MPKLVDHGERRRQIADALLRIASTRGLHAATMREVAAEAGVSLRLVQYYFTSKDELLAGAWDHLADRLGERIRAHADLTAGPRTVLTDVLTALLPVDEESRRIILSYHAYYVYALAAAWPGTERGARDAAGLESLLAGQLRRAKIAAPESSAAALLAVANGLGISVLTGQRDGAAAKEILRHQIEVALTGYDDT